MPRITPIVLTILLMGGMATWISMSDFAGRQNADGLVPILVSVQKWTPYYWGQGRFGMFVPLLATPFRNPLTNLIVQQWMCAFFGLSAFVAIAVYLWRRWEGMLIGLLTSAAFLILIPQPYLNSYLSPGHPYATSLGFMFAGLLLLQSRVERPAKMQRSIGIVLILLAVWVNPAVVVIAGPFVLMRWLLIGSSDWRPTPVSSTVPAPDQTQSSTVAPIGIRSALLITRMCLKDFTCIAILAMGFGFAINYIMVRLLQNEGRQFQRIESTLIVEGWLAFADRLFTMTGPAWWYVVGSTIGATIMLMVIRPRLVSRAVWAPCVVSLVVAVMYCAVMGLNQHVANNNYDPRYALPAVVLVGCGGIGVFYTALSNAHPVFSSRWMGVVSAAIFVVTAITVFGAPSVAAVRQRVDAQCGKHTTRILKAGATHLIGDYWVVWPSVFHANMVLYERGSDQQLWGITGRCEATADLWNLARFEHPVVLGMGDQSKVDEQLQRRKLEHLRQVRMRGKLVQYEVYAHAD